MFVTIDGISQYIGKDSYLVLLATGIAKESTAREAAECISRLVINGDGKMHQANEEFKRIYGVKL